MIDALDALEALEARKPSCYLQSAWRPIRAYPISWSAAIWLWQLGQGSSFATMGSSSGSMASAPMRADTRTLHFDDAQKKAAQLCQDYAKLCQSQRFQVVSWVLELESLESVTFRRSILSRLKDDHNISQLDGLFASVCILFSTWCCPQGSTFLLLGLLRRDDWSPRDCWRWPW